MHLNLANDGNEVSGKSATVQIYKANGGTQSAVVGATVTTTIGTSGDGDENGTDLDIDFSKGDVVLFRTTTAAQAGIYLGRASVTAYFIER